MENYKCLPFWSWNDNLEVNKLTKQIEWMHENDVGGFFMHARGGLVTPYLSNQWFDCVRACLKKAKELNMDAYAYDENGWPSGFAGGKLLEDEKNKDCYIYFENGKYDSKSAVSYDKHTLKRTTKGDDVYNVYIVRSTSTADVCDKNVVKQFINLTHEKYKENDVYHNLKGFFTDEPQYYRARTPFSYALVDYFLNEYNEDIFDKLYLLFLSCDGYRTFRYRYYKGLNDLLTQNFGKQIYDWCSNNGYLLTGHYIEEKTIGLQLMCTAGVMPLYEYEHIPGIDWLSRDIGLNDLAPRQVSSVAAQLNKKRVLAEIFAMVGWDCTPKEYAHIADWLYVNGINITCQHLLPYSEKGDRKRDYPAHWTKINPWINKAFKQFNDHYEQLGALLSENKEFVNVGVFHPLRSAYFEYQRDKQSTGFNIKELDDSLSNTLNLLAEHHIAYHLIDETILKKHGSVSNKKLKVGSMEYDFIVFPKIYTMGKESEILIKQYVDSGGKILLLDQPPMFLEGESFNYNYLKTNTTLEEIIKTLPFTSLSNKQVRISYHISNNKKDNFFYIVNLADTTNIVLNNKEIYLEKYESKIIKEANLENIKLLDKKILRIDGEWVVDKTTKNYLKIDTLSYSKNNHDFSKKHNYMAVLAELIKEKYNGPLFLKYEFNVKNIIDDCSLFVEDSNVKDVYINGTRLSDFQHSKIEDCLLEFKIEKLLKKGINEVLIKIDFFENENVYRCWYDQTVLENIKNSLVYDTNIESIYLYGHFNIEGQFRDGNNNDVILGNNFHLNTQTFQIKSLIRDGYPFFRGDIKLSKTVYVDDTNYKIRIPNRYQLIDLFVNNQHVKLMIADTDVDISNYLQVGENKITIVLTVSNRNLLGPSHQTMEECKSVGPFSWERIGRWENDEFDDFINDYTFVKTII